MVELGLNDFEIPGINMEGTLDLFVLEICNYAFLQDKLLHSAKSGDYR